MSGAYPDAPSRRMAYDEDGTVVLYNVVANSYNQSPVNTVPQLPLSIMSQGNVDSINDEECNKQVMTSGQYNQASSWIVWLFAQKREVDGAFHNQSPSHTGLEKWMSKSEDTTNGLDGVWGDLGVSVYNETAADTYRTGITSMADSNLRGVMAFQGSSERTGWRNLHLYGTLTAGETPDRLVFLDPDNADAEFSKVLDWGDVPRGQTQTDTMKIKNNSASLTASTVQITANDLFDGSNAWYTFSEDDVAYQATLNIGNLGVGATQLVYIKQVVPDAQTPGVYTARARVGAASWS